MDKEQKEAITELAEMLHQLNLKEIEYEVNGVHLRVVGNKNNEELPVTPKIVPEVEKVPEKVKNYIRSPMVGVAYLAKEAKGNPFVKVGDQVTAGQTVCLIEAMKTYNPVKSDKSGRITEILIETGSPVEYNQPLFTVE